MVKFFFTIHGLITLWTDLPECASAYWSRSASCAIPRRNTLFQRYLCIFRLGHMQDCWSLWITYTSSVRSFRRVERRQSCRTLKRTDGNLKLAKSSVSKAGQRSWFFPSFLECNRLAYVHNMHLIICALLVSRISNIWRRFDRRSWGSQPLQRPGDCWEASPKVIKAARKEIWCNGVIDWILHKCISWG